MRTLRLNLNPSNWLLQQKKILPLFIILNFMQPYLLTAESYPSRKILYYALEVNIPDNYSKIEVNAFFRFNEVSGSDRDTLKLMLCEGFKGILPEIIQVSDISHRPLIWSRDSTRIKVMIPPSSDKLANGIYIRYDLVKDSHYPGDPYSAFACEMSDSLCQINAAITRTDNWFPRIAGNLTDRLPPFELRFTYPKAMELVASGSLISQGENALKRQSVWTNYGQLTDRSLFFYAEKGISRKVKNYPENFKVILYVPENSNQEALDSIADLAFRAYRYFESCYGKAPGDELKVLAFYHGFTSGLNFAGIPMELSIQDYKPDANGYPYRSFVHEISHTWWGNIVTANAREEYWLFEGFARSSELRALEPVQHLNVEELMYRRTRLASLPYMGYTLPVCKAGYENNRQLQVVSGYYEGSTLLCYLEYLMGERSFKKVMHAYVEKFTGNYTTTHDFINLVGKFSNRNIARIFNAYVREPGYATYRIEKGRMRQSGNRIIMQYRIFNTGNRTIISDASFRSSIDSGTMHLNLKPGKQMKIKVICASDADVPVILPDTSRTFPFMPDGLKGGGSTAFRTASGKILFFSTVPNTPMAEAGIKDGMELLQIDGQDIANWNAERLTENLLQPKGRDLRLLVKEGKGMISEIVVHY